METKTINYKEAMRRISELERIQASGIELVYKKNMFKIVIGLGLATIGAITLPLPTGSFILIAVGLSMAANGGLNVIGYKKKLLQKIKITIWRMRQ